MPTLEIFGLIVLAGLLWLWFDSLKAREACMRESRAACAAEGLLLLDRDYKIGAQYSKSLETIFNRQNFGGYSFLELLHELVPEKIYRQASDYLCLLYTSDAADE